MDGWIVALLAVPSLMLKLFNTTGNILSALVWLRPSVIHKNSSAIYLGSLAINDTVYLLLGLVVSLRS